MSATVEDGDSTVVRLANGVRILAIDVPHLESVNVSVFVRTGEWIHGSCHDDSGYGVEKTSRQPVALAAISRRDVARIAASIA